MNTAQTSPLALLQQLEEASLGERAIAFEREFVQSWRGFTFNIEDLNLVVPFAGGFEILPCGEIQPLPLSRKWVKGMTNIRGEIYTVIDFAQFIGYGPMVSTRGGNLFLLPDDNLKSALLLDSRISLKTFSQDLSNAEASGFNQALLPFISAVLTDESQSWVVINVEVLMKAQSFVNIGR